jgi:hypothetical protein
MGNCAPSRLAMWWLLVRFSANQSLPKKMNFIHHLADSGTAVPFLSILEENPERLIAILI